MPLDGPRVPPPAKVVNERKILADHERQRRREERALGSAPAVRFADGLAIIEDEFTAHPHGTIEAPLTTIIPESAEGGWIVSVHAELIGGDSFTGRLRVQINGMNTGDGTADDKPVRTATPSIRSSGQSCPMRYAPGTQVYASFTPDDPDLDNWPTLKFNATARRTS